jgi:hypothetical protein
LTEEKGGYTYTEPEKLFVRGDGVEVVGKIAAQGMSQ